MGLTDFAQKVNYQRALQGELARTIMSIDGVEGARIHLSMGEDRIFRDDQVPPKASVVIRMRQGMALSAAVAQGIQRLVAAAVPKLESGQVVILDEAGRAILGEATTTSAHGYAAPEGRERSAIGEYYAAQAQSVAERVVAGAEVDVSAMLPPVGDSPLAWTPEQRSFPLQVTVTTPRPLSAQQQDDLRAGVSGALALGNVVGDRLTFTVALPRVQPPVAAGLPDAGAATPSPASAPQTDEGRSPLLWLAGALAIALVAGLAFVLTRRRARGALSADEGRSFAKELSAALRAERADGTR